MTAVAPATKNDGTATLKSPDAPTNDPETGKHEHHEDADDDEEDEVTGDGTGTGEQSIPWPKIC